MLKDLINASKYKSSDTDSILLARIFVLVDKISSINELKILISALQDECERREEENGRKVY
jgi:hypothetical protein